ncbi:lipoyl(octanoyl) transferase LipB [Halomonadaceae bacterium KBTZ08]
MAPHSDTVVEPRFEWLGRRCYESTFEAMKTFTNARDAATRDECWLLEHKPVFTQGQAGRAEHVLSPGDIPVVQVDRGGQVTYHGPGQLMLYTLIDLRRRGMGVRQLVSMLEDTVVTVLSQWDIEAAPRRDAPGVYVAGEKIASLGLRVRRGCAYHGLALNVDMDLSPFQRINPCGYEGMAVTQLRDQIGEAVPLEAVSDVLQRTLLERLQQAGSD